jgi:hypothetical protein
LQLVLRPHTTFPSIVHLAETRFGFSTSTFLPITPQTPKRLGFRVFVPFRVRRDTPFGLKMPAHGEMAFSTTEVFDLGYPANGNFFSVVICFGSLSQNQCLLPPKLPGSVAGVYKWFLTPGRWPFWCF